MPPPSPARTAALTVAALVGFAANSLLCRKALGEHAIDAASFTSFRLASGALALALLVRTTPRAAEFPRSLGSWKAAIALFVYAAAFSFAYLRLGASVGALVLFGTVQISMIGCGVIAGERPSLLQWSGLALALGGLAFLALPGATAPDLGGVGLMALAGIAWGAYSLWGRRAVAPLATTAANFLRSVPFACLLSLLALSEVQVTLRGVVLALASGALASGVGYSLWYAALPALSATRAAAVQLSVPALAAGGAVVLLGERLSSRLVLAGLVILSGVALAVLTGREPRARRSP